jgi:hypothetical protein
MLLPDRKAGINARALCEGATMTRRDLISSAESEALAQGHTHPDEMLLALELRLPGQSAIAMRFRTTPAGLVATGALTMMTLAGVAMILRSR